MSKIPKFIFSKSPEDILSLAFSAFEKKAYEYDSIHPCPWPETIIYSTANKHFSKFMDEKYEVRYFKTTPAYIPGIGKIIMPIAGSIFFDQLYPDGFDRHHGHGFDEFTATLVNFGILSTCSSIDRMAAYSEISNYK